MLNINVYTGRGCKCKDGFIISDATRFDFFPTCVKCTNVRR